MEFQQLNVHHHVRIKVASHLTRVDHCVRVLFEVFFNAKRVDNVHLVHVGAEQIARVGCQFQPNMRVVEQRRRVRPDHHRDSLAFKLVKLGRNLDLVLAKENQRNEQVATTHRTQHKSENKLRNGSFHNNGIHHSWKLICGEPASPAKPPSAASRGPNRNDFVRPSGC